MNFLFQLHGAEELKASGGHVPESFYEAVRSVRASDLVYVYEGGFIHSVAMHDRLYHAGTFSSYVIFRYAMPQGGEPAGQLPEVLKQLHQTNFARPVESHHHYQVFSMETIDPSYDDD